MRKVRTLAIISMTALLTVWGSCATSRKPESAADRKRAPTADEKRTTPEAERRPRVTKEAEARPEAHRTRPGKQRTGGGQQENPLVIRMKAIVKSACACKDMRCVGPVNKELIALLKRMRASNPSQATSKAVLKIAFRAQRCMLRLVRAMRRSAAGPPANPASPMLTHIRAIHKSACACKTRRCAMRMQRALSTFIRTTSANGPPQSTMRIIARLVLGAQQCIVTVLRATRSTPRGSRKAP